MQSKVLLTVLFLFAALQFNYGQCPSGQKEIIIEVELDQFPWETRYFLADHYGNKVLERDFLNFRDSTLRDTICLSANECMRFIISDRNRDGLDDDNFYRIYLNRQLIHTGGDFEANDLFEFDCEEGAICGEAFSVVEGAHFTKVGFANTWYDFVPTANGRYKISTCYDENNCGSTIWGYDNCNPLQEFPNAQGAAFFNDGACTNGSEVVANMSLGESYKIRIGSIDQSCRDVAVKWSIEYLGEITGCQDSLACNFDPTATISGPCFFAGDPNCPDGPDLTISSPTLENSLRRDVIFNANTCLREEGCLNGYGERTVIRFDTKFTNEGDTDYFIGAPPIDPTLSTDQWEYDLCHNHWHYEGYARYLLFDQAGNEIPVGFKNGFCVLDLQCEAGVEQKYTCDLQGLSVGCADVYDYYLDCQWIDITDVPDGFYTLVAVVNWDHSPDATGKYEKDYTNNWAQTCIQIFRDTSSGYIGFQTEDDCPQYVDCLGIPNGTAAPDCAGNCQGGRLTGDFDIDGNRDFVDVEAFANESLAPNPNATNCNDLNQDSTINVIDAALILECALHAGNPTLPGHSHEPCEFPFSIHNQFDSVWVHVGEVNASDNYVDLLYRAPYGKIEGFQLSMEGVKIESVQALNPDFKVNIFNNDQELLGVSYEETPLEKTIDWLPFLRINVADFLADTVCISAIEALVNENLETMVPMIGDCNTVNFSSTNSISNPSFYTQVIPNPIGAEAQIRFENELQEATQIQIFSLSGNEVARFENVRNEFVTIMKNDLPNGILIYRVTKPKEISSGHFINE